MGEGWEINKIPRVPRGTSGERLQDFAVRSQRLYQEGSDNKSLFLLISRALGFCLGEIWGVN